MTSGRNFPTLESILEEISDMSMLISKLGAVGVTMREISAAMAEASAAMAKAIADMNVMREEREERERNDKLSAQRPKAGQAQPIPYEGRGHPPGMTLREVEEHQMRILMGISEPDRPPRQFINSGSDGGRIPQGHGHCGPRSFHELRGPGKIR
jgi:hypothetical protein